MMTKLCDWSKAQSIIDKAIDKARKMNCPLGVAIAESLISIEAKIESEVVVNLKKGKK